MSYLESKQKKRLLVFTLIVTFFFLIGITIYTVKDITDGTCGSNRETQISSLDNTLASLSINNDYSQLQEITLDNNDMRYYEYYYFCFKADISSFNPLKISVVDDSSNVLGYSFFNNDTSLFCIDIGSYDFNTKNNYLGISCDNCDGVSNNLTLYQSTSTLTPSIINDVVSNELRNNYVILGVKNCKLITFKLLKYLFLFIGLMSLILGIDFAIGYIKGVINDGW